MANNLQLFKQKENEITQDTKITDSLIIKLFYPDHRGYKKLYGNNISNPFILQYLYKRFKDSSSIEETIKRIKLHIEEKPLCPTCGNPVNFIGKPSKMFTTYCSNQCAGKSPSVIEKKQHSDKLKNNGELGWVLSNKNKTKIENRKHTLLKKYGTTNVHSIEEIHEKNITVPHTLCKILNMQKNTGIPSSRIIQMDIGRQNRKNNSKPF